MRETRKLSKQEFQELKGLVAWSTQIGRAILFLLAVLFVGILIRSLFALTTIDAPLWLLPTGVLAYLLYRRAGRWTGGTKFRRLVRQDIEKGEARRDVVRPVQIVEVEEQEDEGPSYFIRSDEDEWILLSGQEMVEYKNRGFPWSKFSIDEAPLSGMFFGISRMGDPVPVDQVIPPLSYQLTRDLGAMGRTYNVLDDEGVEMLHEVLKDVEP